MHAKCKEIRAFESYFGPLFDIFILIQYVYRRIVNFVFKGVSSQNLFVSLTIAFIYVNRVPLIIWVCTVCQSTVYWLSRIKRVKLKKSHTMQKEFVCEISFLVSILLQCSVNSVTRHWPAKTAYDLSLIVRKPVFGVSDKVRFKPVSSATETS